MLNKFINSEKKEENKTFHKEHAHSYNHKTNREAKINFEL